MAGEAQNPENLADDLGLIQLVSQFEPLWNKKMEDYINNDLKKILWVEIARQMNASCNYFYNFPYYNSPKNS